MLVLVVFAGCTINNTKENSNCKQVNISDSKLLDWNKIEVIDIIKLETSEKSLLGEISKLICYDSIMYVVDKKNAFVKAFDTAGKFLFDIGSKGRGKGEYRNIDDLILDVEKMEIIILGFGRILKYNAFTGEYISTLKVELSNDFTPVQFCHFEDDIYYFTSIMANAVMMNTIPEKMKDFLVCKYNRGKIISTFFPLQNHLPFFCGTYSTNYSTNLTLTSAGLGNDTIYEVSNTSIIPYYYINFEDKALKNEDLKKAFDFTFLNNFPNKYGAINNIYATSDYLYFKILSNNNIKHEVLYSKKNSKLFMTESKGLSPKIMYADSCFFYSVVEPSYYYSRNSEILEASKLYKTAKDNVDIADNPIIVKFTINHEK